MAITEHARHQLYLKLEAAIGSEEATTLMEHLPPVGWVDVATKRDLDHFASQLRAEMQHLRAELFQSQNRQTVAVLGFNAIFLTVAMAAGRLL